MVRLVATLALLLLSLHLGQRECATIRSCNSTAAFAYSGRFEFCCTNRSGISSIASPANGSISSLTAGSYYLAVIFQGGVGSPSLWVANPGRAVNIDATFRLDDGGDAVLVDGDGHSVAWRANISGAVAFNLESSGNLQFLDQGKLPIWQSFDHPADLLVRNQSLRSGMQLSSRTPSSGSSHPAAGLAGIVSYSAVVEQTRLAFYADFSDSGSLPYYSLAPNVSCSSGGALQLLLSADGERLILEERLSSNVSIAGHCNKSVIVREFVKSPLDFMRLGSDGSLRGYSSGVNDTWEEVFNLFSGSLLECDLPNACGSYGVCRNNTASMPSCGCPDTSFSLAATGGCKPAAALNCSAGAGSQYFVRMEGTDYFANGAETDDGRGMDRNASRSWGPSATMQVRKGKDCARACAASCECRAAFYREEEERCYLYREVLTLAMTGGRGRVAYVKVQNSSYSQGKGEAEAEGEAAGGGGGRRTGATSAAISAAAGGGAAAVLLLALGIVLLLLCRRKHGADPGEAGSHQDKNPVPIRRFALKQMHQASLDFKCKLGVGGFGSAYKGTLPDGCHVAIKQLENARQPLVEFRAQVVSLAALSHPNLVPVVGFCAEGAHRMLVYEYMPNESLDAWLFHQHSLGWEARLKVAVGVARGLAFLHEEAGMVHLDVKPQNILLDAGFEAKLGDYGLSRLTDEQAITHMRGTPSYMAPEWLLHACATEKSDVYSYGMVLLEVVSGRKSVDLSKHRDSWYLPALAAAKYKEGRLMDLMDPRLSTGASIASGAAPTAARARAGSGSSPGPGGPYPPPPAGPTLDPAHLQQATTVLQIAFWCIQEDPSQRPSMRSVLLMLQGEQKVAEPPLAFQFGSGQQSSFDHRMIEPPTGPSSPSYFNISFGSESASVAYTSNAWSEGVGLQLDDSSFLLASQDSNHL